MLASFDVCVSYGQVIVSRADAVTAPLWSHAHVAQGFAWLPTHVSFGVPDRDGLCRVEAKTGSATDLRGPLWAVRVPFEVAEDGHVSIGTVGDERDVAIPAGRYGVIFAAYPGAALGPDYAFRLRLLFDRDSADDGFAILRAGDELTTNVVLRTDAEPI